MYGFSYGTVFKVTLQLSLFTYIPLPVVLVFMADHAQKDELQNLRNKQFVIFRENKSLCFYFLCIHVYYVDA